MKSFQIIAGITVDFITSHSSIDHGNAILESITFLRGHTPAVEKVVKARQ
jgi:hypothetical protein